MLTSILLAVVIGRLPPALPPPSTQAGARQEQGFSFGNADPEIVLVQRFLTRRHVRFFCAGSLGVAVVLPGLGGTPPDVDALAGDYKREFGVDPRLKGPDGFTALPFAKVEAPGAHTSVSEALAKSWAPGSMLSRAVRQACDHDGITGQDRIVTCTYVVRPWLSSLLQSTECLQGRLVVERGVKRIDVRLYYEDGRPSQPLNTRFGE